MDRSQALSLVKSLTAEHRFTAADLGLVSDTPIQVVQSAPQTSASSASTVPSTEDHYGDVAGNRMSKVLYVLGFAIIAVGIGILAFSYWEVLSAGEIILILLGGGIVAFVVGAFLHGKEHLHAVSRGAFFLSGLMLPGGLSYTLNHLGILDYTTVLMWETVAGSLMILFAVAAFFFWQDIVLLLAILFGSWLYGAVVFDVLEGIYMPENLIAYATMFAGLCYFAIGHLLSRLQEHSMLRLGNAMYKLGLLALLGAAFTLDGIWEVLYPIVTLGVMYLSIKVKNTILLFGGALFLCAYIIKISDKYFADSLGWPILLVLLGVIIVILGYVSIQLRKRFIVGQ